MVVDKDIKLITKKELNLFVNNLINDKSYEFIGVKAKGKRFAFSQLENAEELRLDYDVTILPPKKYFLPQYENLMEYNLEKPFYVNDKQDAKKRIIFGVHPYDIIALQQTDKLYLDEQKDDFYKKRRNNTIIVGLGIENVSEYSFAGSMGTDVTDSGFDLLLTNIGNSYAITIGSKMGKDLLNKYGKVKDANDDDILKIDKIRKNLKSKFKKQVKIDKNEWPSFLVENYNHAIWEEQSDKCMECSSCTMVCPTCFCYNVKEEVSLNLKDGKRIRTWDGCLLQDFTKIGSGEIFRKDKKDRYRHRIFRKGNYLPQRYGFVACVGCGRCGFACLPNIADPCNVINELSHFGKNEETDRYFIKQKTKVAEKGTIHIPRKATIKKITKLAQKETLFELELDDKKSLNHIPGQFVEVSIFGTGEAPISISSSPSKSPKFELAVRKVGNVTSKLFTLKEGDKVGIRGPFGNGFDIKSMENKNILFVPAGIGIFPMRSIINYVLSKENRKKFGKVTILYGCKQPCEVLFKDEVEKWKKIDNVECKMTVDRCPEGECWEGDIGLITSLFPKISLNKTDSKNTIAIIVGPPIVYKFVIKCLETLSLPDENIYVSLERNMKCGVGKCGHCQINGVYVCKEGPVFNYNQIKNLPEAIE